MSPLSRLIVSLHLPRTTRRATLVLLLASAAAATLGIGHARRRAARTTAELQLAAKQFEVLTEAPAADHVRRAAIAWGYSERLRLGTESPFRLVEAAARDPRLTGDERRTVSWALLARALRGETHEVDAAALDLLGPWDNGRSASGEQHLALIEAAVAGAENPRSGELAVRMAYTLASVERLVDGAAPLLAAEAAAMIGDREVARREAKGVVRSARGTDPITVVRQRREKRAFYVERPVLLSPSRDLESAAIGMAATLLDSLRSMRPMAAAMRQLASTPEHDANAATFRAHLLAAGSRLPPTAPLAITVQRYLPLLRSQVPSHGDTLGRARNPEMLIAAMPRQTDDRAQRRVLGRMLLASAVAMRSSAQEAVGFEADSTLTAARVASSLGLGSIGFDSDVPQAWRPHFLRILADGVRDVRRVLPTLRLDGVRIRFRMDSPADSALAMHDPRTRTLHLPVTSAGGTLMHELAHDLDRQSAQQQGLAGYRSDHVARAGSRLRASSGGRIAASLRALGEELSEAQRGLRARQDRPAEIFATRVDWFVANALAMEGISSGFLSAVQDELLTGHVVHPERLNSAGSSRSLVTALDGMTTVAAFAAVEQKPSAHAVLAWALERPIDRRVATTVIGDNQPSWEPRSLMGARSCESDRPDRVALIRLAAESRARGWLRRRARVMADSARPAWARAVSGQGPWSTDVAERKARELRDHILVQIGGAELSSGVTAHAARLAADARCAS